MLSKNVALAIMTTIALSGPALAQTSGSSSSGSATNPSTAAPNTKTWLTEEKPGQWRASKIKGVDIYNNNNEKLGDVRELIVDRDGKIDGVVIGVGGFLGMGEHDVAVPFNEVKWVQEPRTGDRTASSNSATGGTTANTNTTGAGTAAGSAPANRTASSDANRSHPDHGVLNMTKDQLKAAPEFKYAR